MKRKIAKKVLSVLTIVSFLPISLTACGSQTNAKELHILVESSKVQLDPAKSQNLANTTLGLVLRRLTTWDIKNDGSETKVVPDLATDTGTPFENGKSWKYTLKDGIKFENGKQITTKDIKWGIERSFADELSGGLTYHKTLLVGGNTYKGPFSGKELDSIETPDDKTIIFHLERPFGDWPWIVSQPAFSPVPSGEKNVQTYGEHPVASGPYKVESYELGNKLVLVKNDNWSNDNVRVGEVPKIVYEMNQNQDIATDRLIQDAGIDQYTFSNSFVSTAKLPQIQKNEQASKRLVTSKTGSLAYLALNVKSPSLSNLAVRKALQYAVDKNAYRVASGGEIAGDFATTLITPGIEGRENFDLYKSDPSGNVDKAKEILKEAGIEPSSITLKLITASSSAGQTTAQAIQQGIERTGIKVDIVSLDTESLDKAQTGDDPTAYDITLLSWQPDYPSANGNIQPLFATSEIGGGNYNLSRYSNPDVDQKITQAQSEIDPVKAGKLWATLDKEILEDAPVVPLIYKTTTWLPGSKVKNFYIGQFPSYPNYLKVTVE
ncbi:MAG: ABC transporter substrate-binding protein [Candidatus Ancillula sp.]|nr:ABC transporter substrate-binding protein [Candidatus Ancillula sp.]